MRLKFTIYFHYLPHFKKTPMLRQVIETVLLDMHDLWTVQVLNLCGTRGLFFLNDRLNSSESND